MNIDNSNRHFDLLPLKNIKLVKACPAVSVCNTSIEEGHETIHPSFDKFFTSIMNHIYETEDQMENNLMKGN